MLVPRITPNVQDICLEDKASDSPRERKPFIVCGAVFPCVLSPSRQFWIVLWLKHFSVIGCQSWPMSPKSAVSQASWFFSQSKFWRKKNQLLFSMLGAESLDLPWALHSSPTECYHKSLRRLLSKLHIMMYVNLTFPNHHNHLKTNSMMWRVSWEINMGEIPFSKIVSKSIVICFDYPRILNIKTRRSWSSRPAWATNISGASLGKIEKHTHNTGH